LLSTEAMLIENFNHTINTWITALQQYNFSQLCIQPAAKNWSLGQLYIHLTDDANYYIEQIKICVSSNDNAMEEMSAFVKTIFLNNDFPDEQIEGAPAHAFIPQPGNKDELVNSLIILKNEMNEAAVLILESPFRGKTKHPGLGWFNAAEWLQFAEMHFRHHLRQKKRIDDFLKMNRF
jgi:hypothetical protein